MRRGKSEPIVFSPRQRLGLGFVGALLMLSGLGALFQGNLEYLNHYGAVRFAPFAVLVGALAIFVAIANGRRK